MMSGPMWNNRSCRWRSPLLALLWKEWRQQRWVFLTMVSVPALAYAALIPMSDLLAVALSFLFLCAVLIVLAANAFCGETDANVSEFLNAVPVSYVTMFWLKYGLALALDLLAVGVAAVTVVLLSHVGYRPKRDTTAILGLLLPMFLPMAVAPIAAIVSACVRETAACIVWTICAIIGILFWVAVLSLQGDWRFLFPGAAELAILPLLAAGVIVWGARWIWCWSPLPRPLHAKIIRVAMIALAIVVLTGWPLVWMP